MPERTGPFRRADRLLHSREFQHVMRDGRRAAVRSFIVLAARNRGSGAGPARLGITVSRKVGGAVVRNRLKRQVREWYRAHRGELPTGIDLVVIGRRAGADLAARCLRADLDRALAELEASG